MNVEDSTVNSQLVSQNVESPVTSTSVPRKIKKRKEVPIDIVVERILAFVPKDNTFRSNVVVAKLVNADYRAVKKAFRIIDMLNRFPYPIEVSHGPKGSLCVRIASKAKIDAQDMAKQLLVRAVQLLEETEKR
jgi:hypothetical protein